MTWRVRCAGRDDGLVAAPVGMWVERYDATALRGHGWVRWTNSPAGAHQFADPAAAQAAIRSVEVLGCFDTEIEPA